VIPQVVRRSLALAVAGCLGALGCAASRVSSRPIQQLRTEPTACATVRSADSTIYDTTQVTERPVPRSVPKLEYPAEARRRKIQGRAVVTAVVSPEGVVEPPSVTIAQSAQALLDAEARRVVSIATFWPACRDGAAVRARIAIPFDFRLSGDKAGLVFAVIVGVWAGIMAAVMQ
jgi:TonB family protein